MKTPLLFFSLSFPLLLFSQSQQGPLSGTLFGNDNTVGTYAWVNQSAAQANDLQDATVTLSCGMIAISNYLTAGGFGFSIPPLAVINGIEVEIKKCRGDYPDNPSCGMFVYPLCIGFSDFTDHSVQIIKSGNISGNNYATLTPWAYCFSVYDTYGGPSDLWGETWTAADINDPGFGVAVAAINDTYFGDDVAGIDHIQITVYYMSFTTGISVDGNNGLAVLLHSSPVRQELFFTLDAAGALRGTVKITGVDGRSFFEEPFALTPGKNQKHIDVSSFSAGMYLLQVTTENGLFSVQKFLVAE